jgi:hypothetical protein
MQFLWAIPQVLLAFVLAFLAVVRGISKKKGPNALQMMFWLSLVSAIPLLGCQPWFVNSLVARVGPERIVADARALAGQDRLKNTIYPTDPTVPPALRELDPVMIVIEDGYVFIVKSTDIWREALKIDVSGQQPAGPVLWDSLDKVTREGQRRWRSVTPAIDWYVFSNS